MDKYIIDFDDAIYRATGISAESNAMRWADVKSEDGYIYQISIVKRHTRKDIDYFIKLKDPLGNPVTDLQVTVNGQVFKIDKTKSQNAVVIEQKIDSKPLGIVLVESQQEKVRTHIQIKLEKPLPSPSASQKIKNRAVLKKKRSM